MSSRLDTVMLKPGFPDGYVEHYWDGTSERLKIYPSISLSSFRWTMMLNFSSSFLSSLVAHSGLWCTHHMLKYKAYHSAFLWIPAWHGSSLCDSFPKFSPPNQLTELLTDCCFSARFHFLSRTIQPSRVIDICLIHISQQPSRQTSSLLPCTYLPNQSEII